MKSLELLTEACSKNRLLCLCVAALLAAPDLPLPTSAPPGAFSSVVSSLLPNL